MTTVEVRITNTNFSLGLRTAKRLGGKYNPANKTWSIPASANELNGPRLYSWEIVTPVVDPATTWMGSASMDAEHSIF